MTLVFFEMTHVTAGFATQELLNKKVKEKEHKPRLPKTVFAPTLPIISHSMEIIYKRNTCDCSLLSLDHQQVKLHILYLVHTSLYATSKPTYIETVLPCKDDHTSSKTELFVEADSAVKSISSF
jgi:hypothetical protein